MPTLISRPICWIPVLAVAVAAQAQDLHIKKSITVGGNFVSSSDTSIKGARERTVSQLPTGTSITLHQCDLKRTITINEQAQTYLITNDAQDDAAVKAAAMVSGAPQANSGAYITETAAVTDTGERKTLYGFTARHLKAKVTVQSSQNACSQLNQQYEVDGWYADVAKDLGTCQQFLPPVRQDEGCSDRVIRKRSGSAKPGYAISENLTLHGADGSSQQVGVLTSEITKPTLEKELFEIPAGYREVKTSAELNGVEAPQAAPQMAQQPAGAYAPLAQANTQQSAQAKDAMKKQMVTAMFNPAAAKQLNNNMLGAAQTTAAAGSQMAAGMANGMGGMPNGMGAKPGGAAPAAATTGAPLGAKKPGMIRIGVAPPDAQMGQGNNAGADYSTPIRNAEVALMSGPAVEIAALDAHVPMQLQAEAQQKQCDYILMSGVVVKHSSGGSFGKFAKFGGLAASMTPMGAMAHGMGGAVAAQAAGMAASQMAQQAQKDALSQLAGFNGQIKSKDDVTVQYQLVATGQTSPLLQNTLQGKAKSDGEDVLTPLLQQTASAVLTQASKK
jgi:hypothetical protein